MEAKKLRSISIVKRRSMILRVAERDEILKYFPRLAQAVVSGAGIIPESVG
jgi:hypothetical protein